MQLCHKYQIDVTLFNLYMALSFALSYMTYIHKAFHNADGTIYIWCFATYIYATQHPQINDNVHTMARQSSLSASHQFYCFIVPATQQ